MHTASTLPGKLVVFEGPDGSGKSTQAAKIHEFCQKNGIDSILTMEPGGTRLGKIVKDLLHSDMDLDPYASLGLLLAARAQHVKEVVRPAIEKRVFGHIRSWSIVDGTVSGDRKRNPLPHTDGPERGVHGRHCSFSNDYLYGFQTGSTEKNNGQGRSPFAV